MTWPRSGGAVSRLNEGVAYRDELVFNTGMTNLHEIEEMDHQFGPRMWDATPGVCCAYFQTGACSHTEAFDQDEVDDLVAQDGADFIEKLAESERDATCEVCGQSIFRSRSGGFSHQGNTTASPQTCYFPNGSMTTGRPAGYVFDYTTRTWLHPSLVTPEPPKDEPF